MGMKILITGASGLLGRAVLKTFREQSQHDVVGLARSRVAAGLEQLDLLKHSQVERFIYRFRPNVIIHSAAVIIQAVPDGSNIAPIRSTFAVLNDLSRMPSIRMEKLLSERVPLSEMLRVECLICGRDKRPSESI
jgi:NAD(P)-dependent dehydrogenase (short-subunit alcohol dehydrogenase family)